MQMIGHEQKQVQGPALPVMIEDAVGEEQGRNFWLAELVPAALLAAEGDEEPGSICHKGRWNMRQRYSCARHQAIIRGKAVGGNRPYHLRTGAI